VTIVEFPPEKGTAVLVKVAPAAHEGVVTRGLGAGQAIERAERSFSSSLSTIRTVGDGVLEQLRGMVSRPDEVHVEFGLELTAKAGNALLISGEGSAHLRVEMTWRPAQSSGG